MSTSTQSVEIKDPTLNNFHNQRETAYKGTKEQIENNYLNYSKNAEALEAFNEQVRHEGKLLQDGKVEPLPTSEELEKRRESFLVQFEQYKASYEKLKEIAENIHRTIEFLKPVERSYVEEQSLKERSPELYMQTKHSEEICLSYVRELSTSHKSFVSLQNRMCTTLNGSELSWSLQRFCAIVDNKGKPLSLYTRSINYMTTPVVPKPKDLQQNLSSNAPSLDSNSTGKSNSPDNTFNSPNFNNKTEGDGGGTDGKKKV